MAEQACREKISLQFLTLASKIAAQAEDAEKAVADRLLAVQLSPIPEIKGTEKCLIDRPAETWPPLFSDARAALWRIEHALKSIMGNIDKAEI